MNWWLAVGQIVAAVLAAAGTGQIVRVIARRKLTKVETADRLNESTLDWAERLKADAADARSEAREARKEATEARREATEAHRQMSAVRAEAQHLAAYLGRLVQAIHDPHITIDRLRAMAGDPGTNGQATFPSRPT